MVSDGAKLVRSFRRRPLAVQLIASYLVILGVGGLIAFGVGSWRVSATFMEQAHRTALHDLAAARAVYEQREDAVARTVELTAAGMPADEAPSTRLTLRLDALRRANGLDFLALTDTAGRVRLRGYSGTVAGSRMRDATEVAVAGPGLARTVLVALRGQPAHSTEVVPWSALAPLDPRLVQALSTVPGHERAPLVMVAAAPLEGEDGRTRGVLYGGIVLDGDTTLVDRVETLVYRGERLDGRHVGAVAVFKGDVAVATTVHDSVGHRLLGAAAPDNLRQAVLARGATWNGVVRVLGDRYVAADEPIRNASGQTIGILHVGLREALFTSTRNRLIFWFFVVAFLGFVAILSTTYFMIRSTTRPLVQMAAAARRITAGHLDQNVESDLPGEAGLLAESFNTMTASVRQMKGDLEEWGRTLEEKVHQRTEELVTMQARVAQSERLASVGMLAAGVAHEINNPLGGILALSSLAVEDMKPDDPARPNLEEVIRQTERCRDIVKGLLEFSRQSKTGTEALDVNEVLQGTLALVGNQAQFFNVEIVRDYDFSIPEVMADRSQLQQVFTNLLVNGVQAMDERGTITLATRYSASDGHVEVRVGDTGRGIPPEMIDRIFDPFFTTKESGKGTGLGLSIVYGIVTKHGGTIGVKSRPGGGTTFTIRFPAAEAGAHAPSAPVASA